MIRFLFLISFVIVSWFGDIQSIEPSDKNYLDRTYMKARLEPVDKVLHGAGQSTIAFCNYSNALGMDALPQIYMMYVALNDPNVGGWLGYLLRGLDEYSWDVIPQIGLTMTIDGGPEGSNYEDEVANGKYDTNIENLCLVLKEWNKPAFIRIGYEFNGSWNKYKADTYKKAFVRITKALRKHGLDQVATVWCFGIEPGGNNDFMSFYPGDKYVDWYGIDLFSTDDLNDPLTFSFLETAQKHNKPVMIGESTPRFIGVEKGEESWNSWYKPYFNLIRNTPNIKAFCYINWNWARYPQWNNWGNAQIQENDYILQKYREEMECELYLHSKKTK